MLLSGILTGVYYHVNKITVLSIHNFNVKEREPLTFGSTRVSATRSISFL